MNQAGEVVLSIRAWPSAVLRVLEDTRTMRDAPVRLIDRRGVDAEGAQLRLALTVWGERRIATVSLTSDAALRIPAWEHEIIGADGWTRIAAQVSPSELPSSPLSDALAVFRLHRWAVQVARAAGAQEARLRSVPPDLADASADEITRELGRRDLGQVE